MDQDGRCLGLGDTKTGFSLRPLGRSAYRLIADLDAEDSEFVFPCGSGKHGYRAQPVAHREEDRGVLRRARGVTPSRSRTNPVRSTASHFILSVTATPVSPSRSGRRFQRSALSWATLLASRKMVSVASEVLSAFGTKRESAPPIVVGQIAVSSDCLVTPRPKSVLDWFGLTEDRRRSAAPRS